MGEHHNSHRTLLLLFLAAGIFAGFSLYAQPRPLGGGAQAPSDAVSPDFVYRIKVLNAESHPLNGGTAVPKNCDLQNFDAYCNESKDPTMLNTMLVQGNDGKTFSITCTVDSRWSKCAPLPVGETFEAKRGKRGITVLYRDAKGKDKSQFYQIVAASAPKSGAASTPSQSMAPRESPGNAAEPLSGAAPRATSDRVLCNFSSEPPGAEITVDGNFVGNTPSAIALKTGTHFVSFSLAGFTQWKRKLTVAAGSDVNVTATLQKSEK